ncbi:hypothetical protein L6R50_16645 [Myxococcota bacterium]|nr:hypothetical protein [Myxococcota bacterium]
MGEVIVTHPLTLFQAANGQTRSYRVRIRRPLGLAVRNLRVSVDVQERANVALAVQVNHAPALDVPAFATHTANAITDSGTTGLSTGAADVDGAGPLGDYLEVVLKVTGSGGVGTMVGEVYVEPLPG